jgi:hypothetical protein
VEYAQDGARSGVRPDDDVDHPPRSRVTPVERGLHVGMSRTAWPARMRPCIEPHPTDDRLLRCAPGDRAGSAVPQHEPAKLLRDLRLEGLVPGRPRDELPAREEEPVGREGVDVGMGVCRTSVRRDGGHEAGHAVPAREGRPEARLHGTKRSEFIRQSLEAEVHGLLRGEVSLPLQRAWVRVHLHRDGE